MAKDHFFVSTQVTVQTVLLHRASCFHCNVGTGIDPKREFDGFVDIGYLSLDEAKQKANETAQALHRLCLQAGIKQERPPRVRLCKDCLPDDW